MHLYAFAGAPISADFHNRLRLTKILSGKAVVKSFRENYAGNCFTHTRLVVCCKRHAVPMFFFCRILACNVCHARYKFVHFFTTADTEAFKFFPVIPCVRCGKIVTLH